jgi:hypothetical protein
VAGRCKAQCIVNYIDTSGTILSKDDMQRISNLDKFHIYANVPAGCVRVHKSDRDIIVYRTSLSNDEDNPAIIPILLRVPGILNDDSELEEVQPDEKTDDMEFEDVKKEDKDKANDKTEEKAEDKQENTNEKKSEKAAGSVSTSVGSLSFWTLLSSFSMAGAAWFSRKRKS